MQRQAPGLPSAISACKSSRVASSVPSNQRHRAQRSARSRGRDAALAQPCHALSHALRELAKTSAADPRSRPPGDPRPRAPPRTPKAHGSTPVGRRAVRGRARPRPQHLAARDHRQGHARPALEPRVAIQPRCAIGTPRREPERRGRRKCDRTVEQVRNHHGSPRLFARELASARQRLKPPSSIGLRTTATTPCLTSSAPFRPSQSAPSNDSSSASGAGRRPRPASAAGSSASSTNSGSTCASSSQTYHGLARAPGAIGVEAQAQQPGRTRRAAASAIPELECPGARSPDLELQGTDAALDRGFASAQRVRFTRHVDQRTQRKSLRRPEQPLP